MRDPIITGVNPGAELPVPEAAILPDLKISRNALPKSRADITRLLQGADPAPVSEIVVDMPLSFVIVGAPRCGTTALSSALAGNPHTRVQAKARAG